jgi:hypothetical protein
MNFVLSREHLGQIVRFDSLTVITLPEHQFKQGDILVLFNNTDKFTTLESKVTNNYRSAMPKNKSFFEIPPRALINIVFVADDIAVLTVGM